MIEGLPGQGLMARCNSFMSSLTGHYNALQRVICFIDSKCNELRCVIYSLDSKYNYPCPGLIIQHNFSHFIYRTPITVTWRMYVVDIYVYNKTRPFDASSSLGGSSPGSVTLSEVNT